MTDFLELKERFFTKKELMQTTELSPRNRNGMKVTNEVEDE
jgi:hypothetical protein